MNALRYTGRRILHMIPVLLGITLVAFLLLRLLPGDPATLLLGTRGTAEDIAALKAQLGVDRPVHVQYVHFLRDILGGSLGRSIAFGQPVSALILERLPATLFLVAYSTALAVLLTLPFALISALRKDSLLDYAIKGAFVVALSMPSFWLGILLILVFSIRLQLFPVSGYGEGLLSRLWHLFLPALVIGLATAAITIRSLRSSIIAVTTADFIATAKAKGVSSRNILLRHVLRNSLISTVSILGVHTSWIVGGSVVIESVFGIPGLGYLLVSSIFARDYPMVQGLTIVFAFLVILVNLLADISYAVIDPRVSYE